MKMKNLANDGGWQLKNPSLHQLGFVAWRCGGGGGANFSPSATENMEFMAYGTRVSCVMVVTTTTTVMVMLIRAKAARYQVWVQEFLSVEDSLTRRQRRIKMKEVKTMLDGKSLGRW